MKVPQVLLSELNPVSFWESSINWDM
jgi:hypothetical protein